MQMISRGNKMRGVGVGFGGGGITPDLLAQVVPGIDCPAPAPTVGPKYGYVSTRQVLSGLQTEGWQVVGAGTALTRLPERRRYAQHLVRLRHPGLPSLDEGYPELVVRNGHGGNSSFQVMGGFFRTICANGLVVQSAALGSFSVYHRASAVQGVVEAAGRVAAALPEVVRRIEDWRTRWIDVDAQRDFAERALALRWPAGDAPLDAPALLAARRPQDEGDDLWRILNRVQEGLLRGAEPTPGWPRPVTATGRVRAVRGVRSVTEQTRINLGAWALAETVGA